MEKPQFRDHSRPCEHGYRAIHEWTDIGGTHQCPGGRAIDAVPMIAMGGLSGAWYKADESIPAEAPDGYLIVVDR